MWDIEEKLLPHPLAPFLTAFGMAGRTEATGFAGKHEQPLLPAVGTPNTGKATHGIATVEILLDNILDDRTEISILLLETVLIFCKKPLKTMKKDPIEDRALWVMLMVNPCHNRDKDSGNGPE